MPTEGGDIDISDTKGTKTTGEDIPDDLDSAMAVDSEDLPDTEDIPNGLEDVGELPDGDTIDQNDQIDNIDVNDIKQGTREIESSLSDTIETQTEVGTPDEGTTQSATSTVNSSNYSTFEEMYEAYKSDIESIYEGDKYGNNIVDLYDPMQYIGADTTENPTWTKIIMGAAEGDMSMFSSLNLQAKWLEAGTYCEIEWQWEGGHVPSEVLGNSFSLYVDQMYGKYVEGANEITKQEATTQETNGTEESATGEDISSWVDYEDIENVSFSLASAVSYRTEGASKSTPGFDVIDYGQEDYVFGNTDTDARHWDIYVLTAFEENYEELEELFNSEVTTSNSIELSTNTILIIIIAVCAVILIVILICIFISKKRRKKQDKQDI